MADSVGKIINSFKDPEQLKSFCESQYKTILELSKQNDDLKKQVIELKMQLKNDVAKAVISSAENSVTQRELLKLDENDQELICLSQLAILRHRAMHEELTLEEARKVELYSKVLLSIKPKKQEEDDGIKELDSDKLIMLVSNGKESE